MSPYDSIDIYNILTQFCLSPELQTLCDTQCETRVMTDGEAEYGAPRKTHSATVEGNRRERIRFAGRMCMELG